MDGQHYMSPSIFFVGMSIFDLILSLLSVIILGTTFGPIWKDGKPKRLIPWLVVLALTVISGILWVSEAIVYENCQQLIPPVCSIGNFFYGKAYRWILISFFRDLI